MRSFVSHMLIATSVIAVTNTAASLAFAVENTARVAEKNAAESGLVDPTRPSGFSERTATQATSSEKLMLTLIRLGAKPHAIINGETVEPGESIAGYRLLSLHTTSAILSGPNGRTVLQLAPTIRKYASKHPQSSSTHSVQNR